MTRHISKDFTAGTERYGAGSALPETARFRFDTSDSSLIIDRDALRSSVIFLALALVAQAGWLKPDVDFQITMCLSTSRS